MRKEMYEANNIMGLICEVKDMNAMFENPPLTLLQSIFGDATPFPLVNFILGKCTTFQFSLGEDGKVVYDGIEEINPLHMAELVALYYESDDDANSRVARYEYLTDIDFKFTLTNIIAYGELETVTIRFFVDRYLAGKEDFTDKRNMNGWAEKAFEELIRVGCSS